MARIVPIRITKNDRIERNKLAKNVRAKISRQQKTYGVNLESEIDIPKLTDFKTRTDYNKWKSEARSFTNRGNQSYQFKKNKYGVVASVKQLKTLEQNTKDAQRHADNLLKKLEVLPFFSRGVQQSTVGQQMKQTMRPIKTGITRPNDFNFDTLPTKNALSNRIESMSNRAKDDYYDIRMKTMRDNFANILDMTRQNHSHYLSDRIRAMYPPDFYEMYQMFAEMDFDLYSSEGNDDINQGNFDAIEKYLDMYDEGKIDMILKGI